MKLHTKAIPCLLAAVMAVAPISSASAHDGWHHHGEGPVVGLFALGALAVVGVATILTAPVRAIADAPAYPPQGYYPPQPGYYPQQQAYYQQPPVYYAPQPVYVQAPAYYPPRGYYYGRY
jgi:hypothetical protein